VAKFKVRCVKERHMDPTQAKPTATTHGAPPFFAYLEHPEGKWYAVWMTRTEPRTSSGHPWHVHAEYSSEERLAFKRAPGWYTAPYGMRNWDFDTLEEAADHFVRERLTPRFKNGYTLVEGHLAEGWSLAED
jgi:hypothetical protein